MTLVMNCAILIVVLIALLFNNVALQTRSSTSRNEIQQNVVYVSTNCSATPTPNDNTSCWTLSEYLSDIRNASSSNNESQSLILYVLPGNHQIEDVLLVFQSYSHFVLMRAPNSSSIPTISCTNQGHFEFENLASLYISRLDFVGCAGNKIIAIENVTIMDSTFLGSDSMYASYITESGFYRSNYLAESLGAITVINSSISIRKCTFQNNIDSALSFEDSDVSITECHFENNTALYFGGAIVSQNSSVFIDGSSFVNNRAASRVGGQENEIGGTYGGAVSVVINDPNAIVSALSNHRTKYLIFDVHNSTFTSNTANYGGAVSVQIENNITVHSSNFNDNTATYGGAVFVFIDNNLIVHSSNFNNNAAEGGGAVYVHSDNNNVIVHSSDFNNNVGMWGGAVCVLGDNNNVTVHSSGFNNNNAAYMGGAVYVLDNNNVTVHSSHFNNNAARHGGAVSVGQNTGSNVTVHSSHFNNNTAALYGGAMYVQSNNNVTINLSEFAKNSAFYEGGVAYISTNSDFTVMNSNLSNNSARHGGVFYVSRGILKLRGNNEIFNNSAEETLMRFIHSLINTNGRLTIEYNIGSIYVFSSNVTFGGETKLIHNRQPATNNVNDEKQGGAITIFRSNLIFTGSTEIMYNYADYGGAISAKESKIFSYGNTTILFNTARLSGGGIYAYRSEVNFKGFSSEIAGNRANEKGGGIFAISSTISLSGGSLAITDNMAMLGGGMNLEYNAKVIIIKEMAEIVGAYNKEYDYYDATFDIQIHLLFTNNTASQFGGALYIADNTTCTATYSSLEIADNECFFQIYATHSPQSVNINLINTMFENNTAVKAGGTLYGGLLDRCRISPFVEKNLLHSFINVSGLSYFLDVTNMDDIQSISSNPVGICFCRNDQPDCDYQPPPVYVKKGHPFSLSLVAVDQVLQPISQGTIIHSSVSSTDAILSERQDRQLSYTNCTLLQYNVFSPNPVEQLLLYAEGPCKDVGISQRMVEIRFTACTCPIGFKPSSSTTNCSCICDSDIAPYVEDCYSSNQTLLRKQSSWINYTNSTDFEGYITSSYCPFDFCYPADQLVYINLSIANGSDSQCAFNRSDILCGSCKEGLSLTFGRSHCKPCSNHWIALLIPFALAGIALVVFVLMCNLTVAAGTINVLIFYANIVIANRAIFFPVDQQNILTVFIAWTNLDVGMETCFYNGMDAYAKTWLQLIFPAYIIFLIVVTIVISECSQRFANLIGGKNPIATLATLFLLSYAKLLRTIISIFSYSDLMYSDNSTKTIWLFDGKIGYLSSIHIPLFIAAIIIVVIALGYTLLLLSWQWLLYCSKWRCFKWVNNTKLMTLMDAYHAPYQPGHRYWFGLLLLVRVILYLVSALNQFGDPNVNLLAVICITTFLLILSTKVYKNSTLSVFNTSIILNLHLLAIGTYRINESGSGRQIVLIYTSVAIAYASFWVVIAYHCYIICFKDSKLAKKVQKVYKRYKPKLFHLNQGGSNDIGYDRLQQIEDEHENSQFREALDIFPPPTTEDYRQLEACRERLRKDKEAAAQQKVTHSVVEIPKPI